MSFLLTVAVVVLVIAALMIIFGRR